MSHSSKSKFINFFSSPQSSEEFWSEVDPLNPKVLFEEISEEILSYLPLSDLLNASLVSQLWYEKIGNSLAFRKHVVVKLHSWNQETPSAINTSKRSYEVLTVADFELNAKKLQFVQSKNWRDVTMSFSKINSQKRLEDFWKLLNHVKDLKILNSNIKKLSSPTPIVIFPKLENLAMSDVTLDLFEMLIATQPMLKSLSMRFVICDIGSPQTVGEALTKFLTLNPSLKDLELNNTVVNSVFKENLVGKFQLKLRALALGLDSTGDATRENIIEFIKSQGASLEHLKLVMHQQLIRREAHYYGYWEDGGRNQRDGIKPSDDINIIYKSWNSILNLNSLELRFLQNSEELKEDRELMRSLKVNVCLKSLFIQSMDVSVPQSLVMNLLKLSHSLETLYVTELTPAIVRFATMNLKVLRNLKCFTFKGECQVEYTQLKTSQADANLLITITDRFALG